MNLEFTDSIVNLIVLLELIRDGYNIKGSDFFALNATVDDLLSCYSDNLFERIISGIHYPYAMAHLLHKKLEEKHIPNNCLKVFEKIEGQK